MSAISDPIISGSNYPLDLEHSSVIEYLTLNNNQCPIIPKNAMNQLTNFVTNRPNYSSQQCFLTKLAWFLPIRANILLLSCNKADLLGMKRVKVRVSNKG